MRGALKLALTAVLGLSLLAVAVLVGLTSGPPATDDIPGWLAALVVLLVGALSLWKLLRTPDDTAVAPPPWTDEGAMVATAPEATPDTDRISGTYLSDWLEAAADDARRENTVEAGIETIREPLRPALVAVLEQGGWDHDRIDEALAQASWTADPVAAAVVDERVRPPERSLRRRVWAWLFPAKAVRYRTARAIGAIAAVAETELPPVVGQRAPRPVPIVEPTLEDLQRAADGSLRRAVEGSAAVQDAEGDPEAVSEQQAGDTASTAPGEDSDAADWEVGE